MSINVPYQGPAQMPDALPLFPLAGALLLPRAELPLNIFEPRYLAMVDDALRTRRLIGMIQPDARSGEAPAPALYGIGCVGRITQFAETGDGRYLMTLSGVARFRNVEELTVLTPYRQCRADFREFVADFSAREGEDQVDRAGVLSALRDYASANELEVDWKSVEAAPNEALVNALSMMSPFGPQEKQALLEARTLKLRAETLIAITEMELAHAAGAPTSIQ
ncbi:MAG: LON peptidase substrate-binding domain-containing protein [Methylobacteriaceae bacterium]|nr:LON peptidase substrate-binding domain-containing protein [Methylobacteriaceae bacterium]MBV9221276.1 LON peptidase substrate-binding domain-containing protein [Methylobacteriaceae bacterium]MBV9245578.1 LON peptidase substrate-binding domain-containing protein [Methylobacteriaceae bacterium]MBV9635371.1 LON peptidase substrate-binding domain-containing protein [Methylobacteriaceae bacterium]MBV9703504.1 LON peptidase substrate-binding domain-containing protein [Methylobacteriaceae bacterium